MNNLGAVVNIHNICLHMYDKSNAQAVELTTPGLLFHWPVVRGLWLVDFARVDLCLDFVILLQTATIT